MAEKSEKSCGELLVERMIADMAAHQLEPDHLREEEDDENDS